MARPRRSTRQEFLDQFADFDIADQAVVLEFLEEQHRQNKRTAAKRNGTSETESADATEAAVDIAGALKSALNVKRSERTPGAATIPIEGILPE